MKDFFKFYFGMNYYARGFPKRYPKIPSALMMVLLSLTVILSRVELTVFPVNSFTYGFALDSSKNLYIGENSKICIFDSDGKYLRSIDPPTSRGYHLTIDSEDRILVNTGTYFYTLDLDGTVLKKEELTSFNKDIVSYKTEKTFLSSDNVVYQLEHRFLCPTIVRQNKGRKIVYQISVSQCILRIVKEFSFLSLFLFVGPVFAWKTYKLNKKAMDEEEKRRDFERASR